jgi:hypothetical protein
LENVDKQLKDSEIQPSQPTLPPSTAPMQHGCGRDGEKSATCDVSAAQSTMPRDEWVLFGGLDEVHARTPDTPAPRAPLPPPPAAEALGRVLSKRKRSPPVPQVHDEDPAGGLPDLELQLEDFF